VGGYAAGDIGRERLGRSRYVVDSYLFIFAYLWYTLFVFSFLSSHLAVWGPFHHKWNFHQNFNESYKSVKGG
jgi:hypothetical protein